MHDSNFFGEKELLCFKPSQKLRRREVPFPGERQLSALDHASKSSHYELHADLPVWDSLQANKQTKPTINEFSHSVSRKKFLLNRFLNSPVYKRTKTTQAYKTVYDYSKTFKIFYRFGEVKALHLILKGLHFAQKDKKVLTNGRAIAPALSLFIITVLPYRIPPSIFVCF